MKPTKLDLYFNTLRHVKPTQFYHQIFYRLRNYLPQKKYLQKAPQTKPLDFKKGLECPETFIGTRFFEFLNLGKKFSKIDWNYGKYGKLWVYNLNYFEYLHQASMTKERGLELIQDFVEHHPVIKDGLEPYPTSLRIINWIKFLSQHRINKENINNCLYRDLKRLNDSLEYHLLANHLLENAFSLLFGAYYFKDNKIRSKAVKLLLTQLEEQILVDGAHYELSPMYHQIILHRVLDAYNLIQNNSWENQELIPVLKDKAQMMLGWLENISMESGEIPKLNDSAYGIAPTTSQLRLYARQLGLKCEKKLLSISGYRKFAFGDFECVMDVGQIAPNYQPGHSHADNLNFVLHYKGNPIIVDTGISTYEKNGRRQIERSTSSHNTVTINGLNSSEVWDGFRVAKRAKTTIEVDSDNRLVASHNGFRALMATHRRHFQKAQDSLIIEDQIVASGSLDAQGHLHFHPKTKVKQTASGVLLNDELLVEISGASKITLKEYKFAEGFNNLVPGLKLTYRIHNKAKILIGSYCSDNH